MNTGIKSIRPFIGAKNFELSRNFYTDMGFEETVLSNNLSVFKIGAFAFYLQDAYVKDWVDNTMVFMEVGDTGEFWNKLVGLNLTAKYKEAKLNPSGILIGEGNFTYTIPQVYFGTLANSLINQQ